MVQKQAINNLGNIKEHFHSCSALAMRKIPWKMHCGAAFPTEIH